MMNGTDAPCGTRDHAIAEVRAFACVQRLSNQGWRFARGRIPELRGWLVELRTRSGFTGRGYVEVIPVVSTTPAGALAAIETLTPLVLGGNPFGIGSMLRAMDAQLGGHAHVKSAFDGALHELIACVCGQPMHRLLGGANVRSVDLTRIVPLEEPDAMAADAAQLQAKGYRFLKLKLSGEADLDVARVARVRERVGTQMRLSIDPNQAYDVKGAIRVLRRIETFGVDLVEQPVRASDHAGLRAVRDATDMVVEADESATSIAALLELIRLGAMDSVNLKVADLGGLRNTQLAAQICEAAGIGYRIGATFGPRLVAAQGLHLATTFARQDYAQELAEFDHLLDDPFDGLEVSPNGTLSLDALDDKPGSGVWGARLDKPVLELSRQLNWLTNSTN